eukprot:gnl/Dysnectes_brevis/5128_a7238_554.p1 GENE.gnl/Dysnectes_brevis/5128_a7238_554~~gnl/Dysnectes_brevis/5128_a7238_554.p1  ORF type:complete len:235 (+),score=27.90 gnl/Dysnectes_brevis/5128_a7238_554:46-750(+)
MSDEDTSSAHQVSLIESARERLDTIKSKIELARHSHRQESTKEARRLSKQHQNGHSKAKKPIRKKKSRKRTSSIPQHVHIALSSELKRTNLPDSAKSSLLPLYTQKHLGTPLYTGAAQPSPAEQAAASSERIRLASLPMPHLKRVYQEKKTRGTGASGVDPAVASHVALDMREIDAERSLRAQDSCMGGSAAAARGSVDYISQQNAKDNQRLSSYSREVRRIQRQIDTGNALGQ